MERQNKPITLIATIGITPAVLTEALYVLYKEYQVKVSKMIIITTQIGKDRLTDEILNSGTGALLKLWQQLGLNMGEYPSIQIEIPQLNDEELIDIRNKKEDEAFATRVLQVLYNEIKNNSNLVYGLLSGGRKTMSAHLHSAFQLLGRPDDKLLHVLVHPDYEIPGFYFPQEGLTLRNNKQQIEFNASEVQIEVVECPFIPLKDLIKPPLNYGKPFPVLVEEAVTRLRGNQNKITSLFIRVKKREIILNDAVEVIKIPPRPLSLLILYAVLNIKEKEEYSMSYMAMIQNDEVLSLFADIYQKISGVDPEADFWFSNKSQNLKNNRTLFAKTRNDLIRTINNGLSSLGFSDIMAEEIFIGPYRQNRDASYQDNKLKVSPFGISFEEEEILENWLNFEVEEILENK